MSWDYYLGDANGPTDRYKVLPVRTQILGERVDSSASNTICVYSSICSPERRPLTGIYKNRGDIIIDRIVSAKKWSAEKVLTVVNLMQE
jgi:hypothetical protein